MYFTGILLHTLLVNNSKNLKKSLQWLFYVKLGKVRLGSLNTHLCETYGLYLMGLSVDVWAPSLYPITLDSDATNNTSDGNITLTAKEDVNILSALNTYERYDHTSKKGTTTLKKFTKKEINKTNLCNQIYVTSKFHFSMSLCYKQYHYKIFENHFNLFIRNLKRSNLFHLFLGRTITFKPKKKKIVLAERLGVTEKVSKAIDKIVPDLDIDKLKLLNPAYLKNYIPKNIEGKYTITLPMMAS